MSRVLDMPTLVPLCCQYTTYYLFGEGGKWWIKKSFAFRSSRMGSDITHYESVCVLAKSGIPILRLHSIRALDLLRTKSFIPNPGCLLRWMTLEGQGSL